MSYIAEAIEEDQPQSIYPALQWIETKNGAHTTREGRTYDIERTDFDIHELYVDGKFWDSYATHEQARAGVHHHAGRMDERSRWTVGFGVIGAMFLIVFAWVTVW